MAPGAALMTETLNVMEVIRGTEAAAQPQTGVEEGGGHGRLPIQ